MLACIRKPPSLTLLPPPRPPSLPNMTVRQFRRTPHLFRERFRLSCAHRTYCVSSITHPSFAGRLRGRRLPVRPGRVVASRADLARSINHPWARSRVRTDVKVASAIILEYCMHGGRCTKTQGNYPIIFSIVLLEIYDLANFCRTKFAAAFQRCSGLLLFMGVWILACNQKRLKASNMGSSSRLIF